MIPRSNQLLAFAVLLAGTLQIIALLGEHGAPLKAAGHQIGALELAPTEAAAGKIIDAWSAPLQDLALADIRLDYVFIALYSTTLAFAGFLGSIVLTGSLARLGPRVARAMWVAGLCDVLENVGMTAELHGRHAIAPLVCAVSSIKWVLAIGGLAYGVVTLVAMLLRWRVLFDWMQADA